MEKDIRAIVADSTAKASSPREESSEDPLKALGLERKTDSLKDLGSAKKEVEVKEGTSLDYIRNLKTLRSLLPKFDPTV